jgi:ATP-dependent helicase/nuclease subunit A
VDVISSLKPIYARPAFIAGERDLTPAEKGTALHMVMRHLDLGGRLDAVSIAGQVARLVTRELITPEQALAVDCRRIEQFFKSHPGRRLLGALSVKREVPFGLLVPAEEVYPQLAGKHAGERVLVQGVIDCLAEEREGFIIIDYKTDRPAAREGDLSLKYAGQVSMYARAVEAISGRPVLACYLYFIRWGRYVTLSAPKK